VLYWRLNQQFKARMLDGRRQLQALESDLQESDERFARLAGIRDQAGANRQEFTTRLDAMAGRLATLHARLKDTRKLQATYLAELGVHELQQQQERLGTYQVQARYSLAAIYDKAATPDQPAKKPAAEAALPEPATEPAPAPAPAPTPTPEPRP
jgi:chromosome segregation ATPase